MVVSESWLHQDIATELVDMNGFQAVRCDRNGRRGGGIIVWIRGGVKFTHLRADCTPNCVEAVWLHLPDNGILLCGIYVPPNIATCEKDAVSDYIIDCVDSFSRRYNTRNLIICGDLNTTYFDTEPICLELNLTNIVSTVTRPASGTILDIVLVTSDLVGGLKTEVGPPLHCDHPRGVSSDHCTIRTVATNKIINNTTKSSKIVYDLRKSNIESFIDELLRIGFSDVYTTNNPDLKCEAFYNIVKAAMKVIPTKTVTISSKDKPWITPLIKSMITNRWNAYRKKNWPVYNHLKDKVKLEIQKAKERWVHKKTLTVKGTWDMVRELSGKRGNVDWFYKIYGDDNSDITSKLTAINQHFTSVYHKEVSALNNNSNFLEVEECFNRIDAYMVHNLLTRCSKKATGSDGIPSKLYSEASIILSDPLSDINNCCLRECCMPVLWKFAHINPTPKNEASTSIDNLRPISLLPVPSKVLERCILHQFKDRLTNCFGQNQFSYRSNSSTTCALLSLHDLLTRLMDSDDTLAVVLISWDFSKAFDCVSHQLLIDKLLEYKFSTGFISFVTSYLSGRSQAVKYGSYISDITQVTSGVPQGSVLGPLLFCVYISSLEPIIEVTNHMCKYADDTQTVSLIRRSNVKEDVQSLKDNIAHTRQWSNANKLTLNDEKLKAIVFQKSKSLKMNITDIDRDIRTVTELKLLGVHINSHLTWDTHIDSVVKTCKQRLFSIRQLKQHLSNEQLITVFNGLIRSKMEYCCPLFIGLNDREKKKLCRIQNRFHRILCGKNCKKPCVEDLDVRRLELSRRLWCQMCQQCHLLNHLIPPILVRSQHYFLSCNNTERRSRCFTQLLPIILNDESYT